MPVYRDHPTADLHLHSNASDGSDAPARVVQRAYAMGFGCIALADHDTEGGLADAAAEAARLGVELIPAVELSCLDREQEIYVLGYGVDPEDEAFRERILLVLDARLGRARRMVEKVDAMGVAHPGHFEAEDDPLPDALVERLARAGLMGVEVFYPRHTGAMVRHCRELAERLEGTTEGSHWVRGYSR